MAESQIKVSVYIYIDWLLDAVTRNGRSGAWWFNCTLEAHGRGCRSFWRSMEEHAGSDADRKTWVANLEVWD